MGQWLRGGPSGQSLIKRVGPWHDLIKAEHLMSPTHPPGPSRHRHRHRHRHQRPSPEKKQKQGILRSDFSEEQVRHKRPQPEKKQKQGILRSGFSEEQVRRQRSPPEKKLKQMSGEKNINGALSDDLLSNIFDRVPAHDIYKARLVCRRWYHVTHTHKTYALLFTKYRAVFSMGTRDGRVEITKLRQQNTSVAVTDCSQLCLAVAEGGKCTELILSHHSSGVILNLPSLVTRSATPMYSWGVSCARDFMDLKVVVFIPGDPYIGVKMDEFHVLTIGEGEDDDESWRVVQAEPRVFKCKPVLITDGFMHWVLHEDRLLTMNLETEEFTESPEPGYSIGPSGEVKNTYLSTGKYLSLLRECGKLYWEVWEMDPRTFAWRMTGDFSLEEHRSQFESTSKDVAIIPVGWVKYLEVLVLCANLRKNKILIYNLVKEEMEKMKLTCRVGYYSIHPYEV
ncbi:F-box family protein [Striga asiatica]|uniref:F-box family protein n=1 Tax=Striga asiatica TaxID=4170 RepID=A0A5A7QHJ9_STRAF|nr:F-box family protein [Striga asiatica]